MDFHADAFADPELVDIGSKRDNRAHIFMARCKILVERQAAPDVRRRPAVDDLEVGCADGNGIDADQNFRPSRDRCRFVTKRSSSGLPNTQAFICAETGNSGNVLTSAGLYIGADPCFDWRLPCEKY